MSERGGPDRLDQHGKDDEKGNGNAHGRLLRDWRLPASLQDACRPALPQLDAPRRPA
jgi:hypothetical protein